MEIIEEEFIDLRNWKAEVLNVYQAFWSAHEIAAEILLLNPATYDVMRQLAAQNQQSANWVPAIGNISQQPAQGTDLGSGAVLRIELSASVPLSSFQVGVNIKVHS